jgi:GNAT superfamily N-acetyltransferase
MWVRPRFRGFALGRRLAERVIAEASTVGYTRMLLDSLPSLRSPLSLYRPLGFREISPDRYNPEPGAVFMELNLTNDSVRR